MRLGQAARSFNTTTDKIAGLLKENFREVSSHPNVKVTDEEMEFLNSFFAPQEDEQEEVTQTEAIVSEEEAQVEDQSETPAFIEELRPKVITLEKEFTEQTEGLDSYKAEKVSLDGLKVVGKIDLPEPKPKEEKVETEENKEKRPERKRSDRNRKNRSRGRKELSPAEVRAKEERLAYKKKVEQENRQKTLKKQHYENNVKSKLQSPKPKKKKRKVIVESGNRIHQVKHVEKAKKATGLKRFWLWLNGAYDKHE